MDPVPEDAKDFHILNRSDGLRGPTRLRWGCSHFFTDEGSRMFFRSFRNHFPDYMAP